MKSRKLMIAVICLILTGAMALNLTGCVAKIHAADMMEGIKADAPDVPAAAVSENAGNVADFAVRLFKQSNESGKNTLISPLSVLAALSLTLNGAKGDTKAQMEQVLGMSSADLNRFFYAYMKALPKAEKYKLSLANSIWFTSDPQFTVNRDFLQTNADYFGANAYKAPFDGSTLKDINNWVRQKTDGMIPEILDAIPGDAVMYLVNALAFEAEWREVYNKNQVRDGQFTREDGTAQTVDFMYTSEYSYIDDGRATGFVKYYSGMKYAFAALLPNEGITVNDYVASLDGRALQNMLAHPQADSVETALPKFETEYSTEMSDVLKAMGMPAAFGADADFSGLGTSTAGNIFISRVLHKTFISVGEKGTRAGAATVVEMKTEGDPYFEDVKRVYLDRPFVYMLIDTETCIPFFIGTMVDAA